MNYEFNYDWLIYKLSTHFRLVEVDGNVRGEANPFSYTNEVADRRIGTLLVHFRVKRGNRNMNRNIIHYLG